MMWRDIYDNIFSDVARYEPTARGNSKLLHRSYIYFKHRKHVTTNGVSWRCRNFDGKGNRTVCNVRALTKSFGTHDRVCVIGVHNHLPNE